MIVKLVTPRNLLLLALVACSSKPTRPSAEDYKKLDPGAKCEAMAPRALECIDHLMVESMKTAGFDGSAAKDMMRSMEDKPAKPDEDARVWQVQCLGETNPNAMPDAVYACWKIDSCSLFAKCVYERAAKLRP